MRRAGWLLLLCGIRGHAWGATDDAVATLARRLEEMQSRYEELQRQTQRELQRLEEEIDELRATARGAGEPSSAAAVTPSRIVDAGASARPPISIAGDFRLRYEHTASEPGGNPSRDRGVLRGRIGVAYQASERLTLGARLTTGDSGDPNSSDATLGSFTDDLEVSLDRAYVQVDGGSASLVAGKFANPLQSTDLVWDGDVNPQGVAGRYTFFRSPRLSADLTGIFAIVDERSAGSDSEMLGGQVSLGYSGGQTWTARLSAGYYDYAIGSLENADAGDTRGNLLDASGDDYLSDFDLLDVVADVNYAPWGDRWPLALVADHVTNLGAEVSADSGYSGTVSVGRADHAGDLRFSYGYARAETDAVFAAYSHDNTTYSTNYRQHAITIDYVPLQNMLLNLTAYRYRQDQPLPGTDNDPVTRIRLNWSLEF